MFKAFGTCLRKYFDFSSRASRSEFWLYTLFIFLLYALLYGTEFAIYWFTTIDEYMLYMIYLVINVIVCFSLIVPSLAVTFRRLHDANKSGANILWLLLPGIGSIVLFVFYCLATFPYTNKYGDPPYTALEAGSVGYSSVNNSSVNLNYQPSVNTRHQPWKD